MKANKRNPIVPSTMYNVVIVDIIIWSFDQLSSPKKFVLTFLTKTTNCVFTLTQFVPKSSCGLATTKRRRETVITLNSFSSVNSKKFS